MLLRRHLRLLHPHHTPSPPRRPCSSTPSTSTSTTTLTHSLLTRPLPLLHDYLTPQPSHLLTTTLSSFLPFLHIKTPSSHPRNAISLPPGHHLIYFPPPTLPHTLLPDGTDTLHSPGTPWTQRLWAGGSVKFPSPPNSDNRRSPGGVVLDSRRAVIGEQITGARFTGDGKVFITIQRRLTLVRDEDESESSIRSRLYPAQRDDAGDAMLIEHRELCFLQPPTPTSTATPPEQRRRRRFLRPPPDPQWLHPLTPTQLLLARFSALSYNAHLIHLDPLYTRQVYGLPGLLVQGPLLLVLVLECLGWEIGRGDKGRGGKGGRWMIREISYKNLAPVYVGEKIWICGRRRRKSPGAEGEREQEGWEVWIEKDGIGEERQNSLVVRASVVTEWLSG